MSKKITIVVVVAVLVAAGAGAYALAVANRSSTTPTAQKSESTKQTTMKNETGLAALRGDKFDEEFIAGMLAHHEGAVNMSEQAQAVTAREEIRDLAGEITIAQSNEMITMRQWQKDWGYKETNSGGHMSHGGGGSTMAGDMAEMMKQLSGLRGEAHDKKFLALMIEHHEQAVDMARLAPERAKHQEVKDLAQDVIETQQAEVLQMKQWQEEWGYVPRHD